MTLAEHLLSGGALFGEFVRGDMVEHFEVFHSEILHKYVVSSLTFQVGDDFPISDHEVIFRRVDTLSYWLGYWEGLIDWFWLPPDSVMPMGVFDALH